MTKEDIKNAFIRGFSGFLSLGMAVMLFELFQYAPVIFAQIQRIIVVLNPFIYGCVFAYLLRIPCNHFDRQFGKKFKTWKKRRTFNTVVALVMVILLATLLSVLFSLVIPQVIRSVTLLIDQVPGMTTRLSAWLRNAFEGQPTVQAAVDSTLSSIGTGFQVWLSTDLLPSLSGMLGSVASLFSSAAGFLYNIILGLIVCIYMLLSRKKLSRHARALINAVWKPQTADRLLNEVHSVDTVFSGFFGGRVLEGAIIGVICYLFTVVMQMINGFSNGLLISLVMGLTNIIPYIGPFLGTIPSAILILMESPINCLIFIIFVLILMQLDGNWIGPRIAAGSTGLSALWVLFSITLFAGLFGSVGALIGVPLFAVIYNAIRRLTVRGLKKHGRMDILTTQDEP